MASKIGIWNQAVSALGIGEDIASATERSAEARACNLFYDEVVKEVLRDFAWPSATAIVALALVEEDPNDEWAYSYQYPTDCLMARRILSGERTDTRDSRVPYRIVKSSTGRIIYSDAQDAELEYTAYDNDPNNYPSDMSSAIAYLLAVKIAPRLTKGDPFSQQEKNMKLYVYALKKAQANAANEEQPDVEPDPEILRARG